MTKEAIAHYEAALKEAFPRGATGEVFHHWNEARYLIANEALDRMAENARELGLDYEPVWGGGPTNKDYEDAMRAKGLLKLTAALEQPEQEPVAAAWQQGYDQGVADERTSEANIGIAGFDAKVNPARANPYTRPQATEQQYNATSDHRLMEQPAQQEQGDSICQEDDGCPTELAVLQRFWRGQPIPDEHQPAWFKPAQRTWVGLTDWEISQLWIGTSPYFNEVDFAGAIEARLKEKNT